MKVCCGRRSRAWRSMSAEVSMPITLAFGQRLTRSSVELPGPHPMSTILRASVSGTWASKSRGGGGGSSSNLRYCCALQSAISTYVLSGQLLILHPVGDDRVLSEPAHLV